LSLETSVWRGRIIAYAPLFLWIGVIFFLSSGSGSMAATSKIIRPVLEFLFPTTSEESLQLMHFYIRKCAHFTEYAVLALWATRAFRRSSAELLRRRFYIFAFVVGAVVALLDELNQGFISSRTSSIWDVLLDISGGVSALIVYYLTPSRRKTST
jgi:VanZ family protein